MKRIFNYAACALIALLSGCCCGGEGELLETKVFFEKESTRPDIGSESSLTLDLQARLSSRSSSAVDVTYTIAGASEVEAYNRKHGTEYEMLDVSQVSLETTSASIKQGEIYAGKVGVTINGLDRVQEGKPYLLPIRIQSASLPIIEGRGITYLILYKPVRIMKALSFNNQGVRVNLAPGTKFSSLTYEALVRINRFGDNNTIMGREGTLIFRIGDVGGGLPRDILQIAGSKEFKAPSALQLNQWYHLAFAYDQPSGKATMYINGSKVSEATWDTSSFDFGNADFFIGKVVGFMWGERPFRGQMSEVRLWNVARSENQIRENMISVDPRSEGLAVYYKMNGEDQYQEGRNWMIRDASGHGIDGTVLTTRTYSTALTLEELQTPIEVK